MKIKTFPTTSGNLFFSSTPATSSDFDALKVLDLDCIFNLARELEPILKLESKCCEEIIFGNVEDYSIPEDMILFHKQIEKISNLLLNNKNVFVHCMGGHGRTGIAIACIALLSTAVAIDDPEYAIMQTKKIVGGPETKQQIDFIYDFYNSLK